MALAIGILAGVGAVFFKQLIVWGQELLWPVGASFSAQLAKAAWWQVLLLPAAVGLLLGPVMERWAPEVRGPGVPEVMEALALRGGRIRHRVTVIKALVTAAFISAGASVGREGPIVQIGSSIGSSLSQLLSVSPETKRLAVACGAAAGIGATFQAPMAGTLFAVEVLLYDLEVRSLSNIVMAAVAGTMTARLLSGESHVFLIPSFSLGHPLELLLYFGLGLVAGLCGLVLMGTVFGLPKLWRKIGVAPSLMPAAGGLLLGGIALLNPAILGLGYDSIDIALAGKISLGLSIMLFGLKLLGTGLCIGSGMSGGIFSPSLFLGAMLGTLVGSLAQLLWPNAGLVPAHYALIGMGAMVGATTLAPITAIFTIFELTSTFHVIVPLMVACIASTLIVRWLHGYSIYESNLLQRGIDIVKGHEINILRGMRIGDHMSTDLQQLSIDTPCTEIMVRMEESNFPHFLVMDRDDRLAGILTLRDFRRILAHPDLCGPGVTAESLMIKEVVTVSEEDSMEQAFHLFAHYNFSCLPVMSGRQKSRVVGQLKKTDLLSSYEQYVFKEHVLSPMGWVCPLPRSSRRTEEKD